MDELLRSLAIRPEPWDTAEIAVNLAVAFALGVLITWVYRGTNRQLTSSFSFVNTLVLLSMIMSVVMMVIGNSIARAFGLAGAMSIIRFRTVVKDVRDTAFVFFSLGIGMATGTGNLKIATVGTLLVSLFIWVLHWTRHGATDRARFLLSFERAPTDDEAEIRVHRPVFDRFLRTSSLVDVRSQRLGQFLRYTYHVQLRDPEQVPRFVAELSALEGIQRVSCTHGEDGEV
jgi:uncharacterized membrane protein YhiD involved in acid resistance